MSWPHCTRVVVCGHFLAPISDAWNSCGYLNFTKYLDTQKICWNHSKIWTMWLYHRVMSPNDAEGIANSVDPDQTRSSLIWVCTVCPSISIWKLRIITVCKNCIFTPKIHYISFLCYCAFCFMLKKWLACQNNGWSALFTDVNNPKFGIKWYWNWSSMQE